MSETTLIDEMVLPALIEASILSAIFKVEVAALSLFDTGQNRRFIYHGTLGIFAQRSSF
jgi:hypothetical protein